NLNIALNAEDRVRAAGAVPATIGIYEGVPTVGLSQEQIEKLTHDDHVLKAGTRDLAIGSIRKMNAGTTIAATCFLARLAGIDVVASGGLGGVHHGASENFDESSDLTALASNPVVIVS